MATAEIRKIESNPEITRVSVIYKFTHDGKAIEKPVRHSMPTKIYNEEYLKKKMKKEIDRIKNSIEREKLPPKKLEPLPAIPVKTFTVNEKTGHVKETTGFRGD